MPIPPSEVRVLDRNAEALGVSVADLMERAGAAVAERALAAAGAQGRHVVVLVGPGNNGGDGLVAARLLADKLPVRVLTTVRDVASFKSREARRAFERLPATVGVTFEADARAATAAVSAGSIVIDALLGVGVHGALREPFAGLVAAVIDARGAHVIAVDVPTGFGGAKSVRADETVTFHDAKVGMTRENAGLVHVANIGIPARARTHTGPGEFALYPRAKREQHKGEGGIVLVIGGGPYTGAPAVAGLSALRAGADLAIVLTPRRAASIIASYSPNLVVRPLNKDDLDFDDPENRVTLNLWLKKAHSVIIGPGLGLMGSTIRSVQHAVDRCVREGKPVVVDADAISAFAEKRDLFGPNVLVSPHRREFRTLTGREAPEEAKRPDAVKQAARELKCTLLLKGPIDVVSDGERVKENETGHPAMSVGGTGDALAGLCGALLAKGLAPFDAARLGAYWLGKAGELAVREKSYGLMATDVVEAVPHVLRTHLE